MNQDNYRQIAINAFNNIRDAFPALEMTIDPHHQHVDINMDIKKQPGLDFDVNLNLQNVDELHLSAGSLWIEWFPCSDQKKVDGYLSAVKGLLSGKYRILEHRLGNKAIAAELQRPTDSGWETIASRAKLRLPSFRKRATSVLQNKPAGNV